MTKNRLLLVLLFSIFLFLTSSLNAQSFELLGGSQFYDMWTADVAFSDIDNDGDQDVLLVGNRKVSNLPQTVNYTAVLYENDGNGNFEEIPNTPFLGLEQSAIAFADIDNDNDEDVLITGLDYLFDPYTRLYTNDGSGKFTEVINTPFRDVYSGDVVFADVDDDNDLDVFVSGSIAYGQSDGYTALYLNDGNGIYVEMLNTPFRGGQSSAIDVADIDLDGDIDMIFLGTSEVPGPLTEVYLNDGTGKYSVSTNSIFLQLTSGDVEFSDIDNDGDADLLITGTTDTGLTPYTQLFRNDGTGSFNEIQNSDLFDLKWSNCMFFDFDNDNDQDLLVHGKNASDPDIFNDTGKMTLLLLNDGTGNFTKNEAHPIPPIDFGKSAYADVNGDNLMDIFITGRLLNTPEYYSEIFLNTTIVSSTANIQESNNIELYPNPVSDGFLNVKLNFEQSSEGLISIFDLTGKVVKTENYSANNSELSIDLSGIEVGYYILNLMSKREIYSKKICIVY